MFKSAKRFVCLVVVLVMVVSSFSFSAFAISQKQVVIRSEAECERWGLVWLEWNYSSNTIIDSIIPIYDGRDVISYCVSFSCDSNPNGYVVIDIYTNVVEFALSGDNIYDAIHECCREINDRATKDRRLYSTGLFSYAVSINEDNTRFYNSTNEIITASELNKRCNELSWRNLTIQSFSNEKDEGKGKTIYDLVITLSEIPSTGAAEVYTIEKATRFYPTPMYEFCPPGGFSGNCAPTAAANILIYYKERRNLVRLGTSRQDIYNRLVSAAGWNQYVNDGSNGIDMCNAIKKVAKAAGYSSSYSTFLLKIWRLWENSINDDYPVYTSITANNDYHAVVAFGYRKYEDGKNYLRVWDGWSGMTHRYICFVASSFNSTFPGYAVNIW